MSDWLRRMIEPLIDGIITRRILMFHRAMIKRGQIKPPPPGYGPKAV